ncbi:hypothetical protein VL15_38840 [Burkholderia cepacia]|uniref:Tir chaperone family protein n=1 Tax=Burkholderia cepacia TaxID=292 RepID=A0A0J5VQ94_BURCE|nr:type III secretion system chaperone [Burkholderia cepacia]KML37866.1 hypothetical protein VL15_38840 [Burkholderia cepacia]
MSFQTFLQSLGAAAHVDIRVAEQSGGCTICFDEHLEVVFEHDVQKDVVRVFATVFWLDSLRQDARSRLCELLLQLHLFGLSTDGNYFGYDPQLERVILFRNIPLVVEDIVAVTEVESFVNQLERWQKGLLDYVSNGTTEVIRGANMKVRHNDIHR